LADIAITDKGVPNPVRPGVPLTYTLTITNNGPSDARNIVVTDTLSNNVTMMSSIPGTPTCTGSKSTAYQVNCSQAVLNAFTNMQIVIIVNVNISTTGVVANQAIVSSENLDQNHSNNSAQVTTVIDAEKPLVNWVSPVQNELGYFIQGGLIQLKVDAVDNIGVERVHFFRWDKKNVRFVDIGNVYNSPYLWNFDTNELYYEWNEIDAEAYDLAGNVSDHKYIFVYRYYSLFLPFIQHQ
jgi:uncharacterized repeat protein (TIGR01451 family)